MANIVTLLKNIKEAVFGKDVRDSIHDAIKQCYNDAIANGHTDMEVVKARGSHNDLNARLESDNNTLIKKDENLQNQIKSIASGSPKGVYATVSELESANPDTGVYVVIEDGHIYSWTKNGSSAIDLGVYQSTGICDNEIGFNALSELIQNFFEYNMVRNSITWEEGYYYNTNGTKQQNVNLNCVELSVTAGEIYNIIGYGSSNAKAYVFKRNDGTIERLASNGYVNDIVIIPANVNKLLINWWTKYSEPLLYKCSNLVLNSNEIDKIQNMIDVKTELIKNAINYQRLTSSHSGHYFRTCHYTIPSSILPVSKGDRLVFKMKVYTKFTDKLFGVSCWEKHSDGYGQYKHISMSNINDEVLFYWASQSDDESYSFLLSPSFIESFVESEAYLYNISITNETTGQSINGISSYITTESNYIQITDININLLNNSNILQNIIKENGDKSYLKTVANKTIICAGDSLTVGYNNVADNSYVDYLQEYYPECIVLNRAHNGWTAKGLLPELCNMTDKDNYYGAPSDTLDYTNVCAVIINMGTNGGITGNIETSIPQIANARDLEDNNLTNLCINKVLSGGIKYNGIEITTESDYWNLFGNDWYGNMGLAIEYIQWKNPKTQIFLLPPCISSIEDNKKNSAISISGAMKQLVEFYGVNYIDSILGIGINRRNEYLYRGDYVHGTNLRNEIVGKYVAKQIFEKIYE